MKIERYCNSTQLLFGEHQDTEWDSGVSLRGSIVKSNDDSEKKGGKKKPPPGKVSEVNNGKEKASMK